MNRYINKIKGQLLVILLLCMCYGHAQITRNLRIETMDDPRLVIIGDQNVNLNETRTYTISAPGVIISSGVWNVLGATIISQSTTSTTVKWTSTGIKTLRYRVIASNYGRLNAEHTVTVTGSAAPGIPATPTIDSNSPTTCSSATLTVGSPPSGVSWYWQGTNSNGTSTAYPASSNYTVSSSGTYYLRARNSSGVWSLSSSSRYVNLSLYGATWYADTDGDGLGDQNNTKVQCTQPTGYVSNSNDNCPDQYGNTSNGGCPASNAISNENYVYTIVPQIKVTNTSALTADADAIKSISYFDGLGRLKQSIAIQGSDDKKDIVTHVGYDAFGRQEKEYLPYTATNDNGVYNTNAEAATLSFYNTDKYENTANPYSEKAFEASPLGRVLKQAAPGEDWKMGNGHEIAFEYHTNTNTEVKHFVASTNYNASAKVYTPNLTISTNNGGYYQAGELYKTITKDENHSGSTKDHTTEEFKDKQGRMVLKRTYESGAAHDTYYVYDDFGNLTYVLPPLVTISDGVSATELSELCYQYKYDHRNRLVEKKIPGKDWEYIIYDTLDRPVMTQDAVQRPNKQWLFTKYDVFGRVAYTGIHTHSSVIPRSTMQSYANNTSAYDLYETRTNTHNSYGGVSKIYYSNEAFPASITEVLTINYYDDYNFDLAGSALPTGLPQVYGKTLTSNVKGLSTGSKVKVLETNDWITTVTYYDDKARAIYVYNHNTYLNTTDTVKSDLDFAGRLWETTTTHTNSDTTNPTMSIVDAFNYDHMGRLIQQTQKINNSATTEVIVENSYDELGQLESKGVGGKTTQSRLQNVNYTYNVRGWLKQINDTGNLGSDLFSFKLNYNTPTHEATELFNGNISETEWRTANTDNNLKWYRYSYDALNRITKAIANNNNYSLEEVDYDKNGNILNLQRRGHINDQATLFGTMDKLVYTYESNSNRLKRVQDNGNDTYGFKDEGNPLWNDYTYDANGNMKSDINKMISVRYNHLNLPKSVHELSTDFFTPTSRIEYVYDALGNKLAKKHRNAGFYASTTSTYYAGNFIYSKFDSGYGGCAGCPPPTSPTVDLKFFNHPEGYVEPNGSGGFEYVYQYKDHLGNVRLSYKDSDGDGSISEAGIFYDGFETGSGWDGSGNTWGHPIGEFDTTFKKFGKRSGRVDREDGNSNETAVHSNEWVPINISQSTDFIYSAWVYLEDVSGNSADLFLFMKKPGETGYLTRVNSHRTYERGRWVYLEKKVTVPSYINRLNIRIDNNGPGTVWFDDVKIRKANSEILEENNYYPFGLKHKGYNSVVNSSNPALKYKFGGKEYQDELGLGWYDITARNYDPALGRWMNLDPLAEEMRRHSPYNYAFDNPIFFIDPDGMMPFGNGDKPPKRTTQAMHSFKYDTNSKGVKKDVGTDYISETQTTSTTNVVDGKNVYTTITSNVVVSIDADGVIDKDNVKQTVYINTSISDGEGNIEHESSQLSGTISFSQTSPEQQAATETIASDKQEAGRSPLQDQADNINLGKDVVVGIAAGVATAGASTTTQLVAAGVAGVGSNKLIPGITAENVKNELYRKTEELD